LAAESVRNQHLVHPRLCAPVEAHPFIKQSSYERIDKRIEQSRTAGLIRQRCEETTLESSNAAGKIHCAEEPRAERAECIG